MSYQSAKSTHELWLGYTNNDPVFQYWISNTPKNIQVWNGTTSSW
jgi:hypothetical protein